MAKRTLREQEEMSALVKRAQGKFKRQKNLEENLDISEFHYKSDILSMDDISGLSRKKYQQKMDDLKDYLSPKGAIVRINDRNESDVEVDAGYVNGVWQSKIEHHDEYVTLKDFKAMKKNLKSTNDFAKAFDKALASTRVQRVRKKDGTVETVKSMDKPMYGEDPGLIVTSVDVGGKELGYAKGIGRSKSAKTREKFFRTKESLEKKASYFTSDKVKNAKANFIKAVSNQISDSFARKLKRALKDVSAVEFYYLQKATEGFHFDFYYNEEDLDIKKEVIEATVEAFKKGAFDESYQEFRKALEDAGIIDGED